MTERFPAGKLPSAFLATLLSQLPADLTVLVPPGVGRDAAAVQLDEQTVLVLTADPITFATDEIGWYAVQVNANDVACLGAEPRWFLATVLLPEADATPALAQQILADLQATCAALRITLVGGHTEITVGLPRPIVSGALVGVTTPARLIVPGRAQPGDVLIVANGIAIEGTAILARECASLLEGRVPADLLERARRFLHTPGISVVAAARALTDALGPNVHALHDPTEGGLATGVRELAQAAGLGATLYADAIPIYPETRQICDVLGLDPLGLIASGALLAAVAPEAAPTALQVLADAGIPATHIGELTASPGRYTLVSAQGSVPLPDFPVDELARFFTQATGST